MRSECLPVVFPARPSLLQPVFAHSGKSILESNRLRVTANSLHLSTPSISDMHLPEIPASHAPSPPLELTITIIHRPTPLLIHPPRRSALISPVSGSYNLSFAWWVPPAHANTKAITRRPSGLQITTEPNPQHMYILVLLSFSPSNT